MYKVKKYDLSDLSQLKEFRFNDIDERTGELISAGFTHESLQFSLSQNSQINISALHQSKDDVALTYPIKYNTIDDLDCYDVPDASDLHVMYLTALATKKGFIDSGTALKQEVRDAVDIEAVNLILDER